MIKTLIYDSRKNTFSKIFLEKYATQNHLWCVQVYYTLGPMIEEYEILPEKKVPFSDLVTYMQETICDLIPDDAENSYFLVSKIKHTKTNIKRTASLAGA
jgi:hypothetical protein